METTTHLLLSSPFSLSSSSTKSPSFHLPARGQASEKAGIVRCSSRPRADSWDSNAETARREGRFRFQDEYTGDEDGSDDGFFGRRRNWNWWSDDAPEFDPEDDDDGDLFEQDPWDAFWIIKVFKPFGWMLPAIVMSTLLASGPKAFLMALALPLGQSAFSFAVDKLWGKTRSGRRYKAKAKKKPFAQASSMRGKKEQEGAGVEDVKFDGMGRPAYQSWAARENGQVGKDGGRREPSFGGWDELETARRAPSEKRTRGTAGMVGGKARPTVEKEKKLSRRTGRKREVPLLLRLLIAVFPFLGSWTKLL